jgi:hypothetical protein
MNLSIVKSLSLASAILFAPALAQAQQVPDLEFAPVIERAEYDDGQGPTVLVDAAHLNFHTADGGYAAFAKLLRRDGYRVGSNTEAFSAESLARADVLVIANAMHADSKGGFAPLPSRPAFTEAEIAAVERWVRGGGALLLIADHMPIAGHTETLAAAFGVRFHNGFLLDPRGNGDITFRRSEGSLVPGLVADGRRAGERVERVTTFTGQAFRVDPGVDADPLLLVPDGYAVLLPEVAWQFSERTPRIPAANLLQGALVRHGEGRVAVFGEAAAFTAQLAGPQRLRVGMSSPQAPENARYLLNVLHWLGGTLR